MGTLHVARMEGYSFHENMSKVFLLLLNLSGLPYYKGLFGYLELWEMKYLCFIFFSGWKRNFLKKYGMMFGLGSVVLLKILVLFGCFF